MNVDKPLTVVVIASKLPEDIWLINRIADVARIVGLVLPTGRRYREYNALQVLRKRIPTLGILKVADQALLVLYRRIFERRRDQATARRLFADKPTDRIERSSIDILETDDANCAAVRDFLLARKPRLVVVSGAPLLGRSIIEAAGGRMINLHPGYAPQYRGRYGSFWPIYNREPHLVGTTVHFIDEGVDTGPIIAQELVAFEPDDTLGAITCRQHRAGGELLVRCLQRFDELSAAARRRQDCPDRNYTAPGLTHYVKARVWLRRNRRATAAPSPGAGKTWDRP